MKHRLARPAAALLTAALPAAMLASLLAALPPARAEEFPAHPVRLIVPLAAGSAVDTLARIPAQKLAERWGQRVIVDNRVGANGIIGTEAAAKAPPGRLHDRADQRRGARHQPGPLPEAALRSGA